MPLDRMPGNANAPIDRAPGPQQANFAKNPDPRCACVLLLDVSQSMSGDPITQLNEGLKIFAEELIKDSLASIRTEVAVITFSDDAKVAHDFKSAVDFAPPYLSVEGATNMGKGIELALDEIENRKVVYNQNGVDYYRPWLFMITDGAPTDNVSAASNRLHQVEKQRGVSAFAVGVEGADMDELRKIFPREPMMLKGLAFREMFQWLSASMSSTSGSNPGDQVALPDASGWGTLGT